MAKIEKRQERGNELIQKQIFKLKTEFAEEIQPMKNEVSELKEEIG
jgi:hypothetical protein